jgi:hypothetical protein
MRLLKANRPSLKSLEIQSKPFSFNFFSVMLEEPSFQPKLFQDGKCILFPEPTVPIIPKSQALYTKMTKHRRNKSSIDGVKVPDILNQQKKSKNDFEEWDMWKGQGSLVGQ